MHMATDETTPRFETLAIHAGQDPDPATGAVIVPIYQTSTFAQEEVGKHKGFEYGRTDNPTRSALQTALAALEQADWGLCYASGLAATQNTWYLLNPGDHLILSDDAYGGTYRLAARVASRYGITFSMVDLTDLDAVAGAIQPNTRMIWVETPTNPYLKIVDIAGIREVIGDRPIWLVVDNTFASPYLQQPLTLGADLVLHSTTKYLGGHSDVIGGAVLGNDPEIYETLKFHQNAAGAVPGPFDCWLVLRGIKTLSVRMREHSANGKAIAEMLREHPAVEQVFYPGLPDHPGHMVARRQMPRGFGGMVSFTVRGGYEAARTVVSRTRLFTLAESLGGVESLIEHPGQMTHASLAGSGFEVAPNLIRLSVGIEHVDDLIADLREALSAVVPASVPGN
ncbi:cystathionine gamma-synthase [Sphaerobacter sp.]|uniref:cystathionine gamma-synthase n=1 Tax=Sphaerobacter sp. TaxID=2099654 RepID=UPI001D5D1336|nr:cystathionine gamma-synthase [Sphaerobacter sp.]